MIRLEFNQSEERKLVLGLVNFALIDQTPIQSRSQAAVHLTLRMLRSIRLTNQKIEFYKSRLIKKCFEAFVAPSGPQP